MKRISRTILLLSCLFLHSALHAQSDQEYRLKATFIYNFSKYIYWLNLDPSENFKIGVFGDGKILESLRELAQRKSVSDRKIEVVHYTSLDDTIDCHILYIAPTEERIVRALLEKVKNKPILTVSEMPGFTRIGGALSFVVREGKPRIEINPRALSRAGLFASAQLLRLAILTEEHE